MIRQRPINLNPEPSQLEAIRIIYPPDYSRRSDIKLQPMRFIPHDGRAGS